MKPIIRVESIGKEYRIGEQQAPYATIRETITKALRAPFRRFRNGRGTDPTRLWALRDVSFSIQPGEVVGVIGRNGAGKSTLLKILSRVTEPTEGQVDLYGRVGSLLEVGTGFHPELTGRENIFLNGAILGMRKREIQHKFDEIVAFSEIDQFIDTPVKHYSSGMYMRLAFAVAAHLETEILLIDEVLAVGDYAFQQKCLQKAGQAAGQGVTVLLVSHNLAVLGDIAERAIWLEKGKVREDGSLSQVIASYVSSASNFSDGLWREETEFHDTCAYVTDVRISQLENHIAGEVMIDTPFEIELKYRVEKKMPFCRVGLVLSNTMGTIIFSTAEPDEPSITPVDREAGEYKSLCVVPSWLLAPGRYFVTPHIDDAPLHRLFTANQVCSFTVIENAQRGKSHYSRPGLIAPKLPWSVSTE